MTLSGILLHLNWVQPSPGIAVGPVNSRISAGAIVSTIDLRSGGCLRLQVKRLLPSAARLTPRLGAGSKICQRDPGRAVSFQDSDLRRVCATVDFNPPASILSCPPSRRHTGSLASQRSRNELLKAESANRRSCSFTFSTTRHHHACTSSELYSIIIREPFGKKYKGRRSIVRCD